MFTYLNSVVYYLNELGFNTNPSKNNIITFQRNYKNKQNYPKIYLEYIMLKDLFNSNFLYITVVKHLKWNKQIEMLSSTHHHQAYTY